MCPTECKCVCILDVVASGSRPAVTMVLHTSTSSTMRALSGAKCLCMLP